MKNEYDKAAQISDLVVGLELIDRTLASIRSQLTPTPLTQKQLDVIGVLVRINPIRGYQSPMLRKTE